MNEVKAWIEVVSIPTYGTGKPEKLPMFLEKRVYQGSSGLVYPNAIIEKVEDQKKDRDWTAVFLENRYIKVMLLPELGGRIQMAYDKTKQRHFVYYNSVIKPALVGLTGPWISGGIEFNWPQHHRPSTYEPVDYRIEEFEDGSKTVWLSEHERMFRTKGMAGITLYPDKAYIEVKVQLYNPTPVPKTFLWWANPAVKVNDHYQSIFPPDVHAVYDHGKRDVSTFPIATGTYYKYDYSEGVDISRYKNIPVPTSFMAVRSKYDFIGGYEHDTNGGLLHVANHHISPGKKQWTWGCGDFGQAWDRNLTDEDGPYIELMCGVYTDNQPDFSWLAPYEEKSFRQYFMPYRDVGVVKNASKEAMVNLEKKDDQIEIKAYTTSEFKRANIRLLFKNDVLLNEYRDLSPEKSYKKAIRVNEQKSLQDFAVEVLDKDNKLLIAYQPEKESGKAVPEPAKSIDDPENIPSVEQLYLSGLHLEQYRHATFDPTRYYKEALKREPGHVPSNNALGLWYLNRGRPELAEKHFRKATETLTERNPNPLNGEAFYNLGLCLKYQGNLDEAYDHFYKAVWNAEFKSRSYYQLATLDSTRGNFENALQMVNRSLLNNDRNHASRALKTALLRKLGNAKQAIAFADESLQLDAFNFNLIYEKYLVTGNRDLLKEFKSRIRDYVHNYIESALAYASAGFYREAMDLLEQHGSGKKTAYPMVHYLLGWFHDQDGNKAAAQEQYGIASTRSPDYCFPNRLEESRALSRAVSSNPGDARAHYYLGNYWYANRQYSEAIDAWETAAKLDPSFGIVHRNLAIACFNKLDKGKDAIQLMEKAFELDPMPRMLLERVHLLEKMQAPPEERLQLLEKHPDLVRERDDLYLEKLKMLNLLGQYEPALEMLRRRKFHPWEGGEGKVTGQYIISNLGLAREAINNNEHEKALGYLEDARHYPVNLGEGKLAGAQENDINYWMGIAHEQLGDTKQAKKHWELAATGPVEPSFALYYNDQEPDKIFYQGLALQKLGKKAESLKRFDILIEFGEKNLDKDQDIDYFAVSYPDMQIWEEDIATMNKAYCYYLIGLGKIGKGDHDQGEKNLQKALDMNPNLSGAIIHLEMIKGKDLI